MFIRILQPLHFLSALQVTITSDTDSGIEPYQVTIGVLLLAYGTVFLFGLPSTFMEQKFDTFLTLLNVLLVSMLIGACVIVQLFQPITQKMLLFVLIPPLKMVSFADAISKHRDENRVTNDGG